MDQAASSKVSRDEVHRPPPRCCCCSKSLESKYFDWTIFMNLFQAANAWDAKETFLARNEVEALSCKNGKDSLADGQEVKKKILTRTRTIGSCHIWSPGHHRDSQLPRELPQQGQVQLEDQGAGQRGGAHLVRDLWSSQGRFLEGENFVCTNMILILWLQIKGVTAKLYGSYENGIGEIIPATNKARTLKVQFRSNKKKNAGGFRCQVSSQCGSSFNDFVRSLLLPKLPGLDLDLARVQDPLDLKSQMDSEVIVIQGSRV